MEKKRGAVAPSKQVQSFWVGRTWERALPDGTRHVACVEGRSSLRRRCSFEALINHGSSYSTSWQVRDLNLEGAFVEAESGHLPAGADVEVVLSYRRDEQSIEVRLPAVVKRVDATGMALNFGRYDNLIYTNLVNLLYAL
ncbi:MAG TPA: PilZ domain-containing protein [Burkholderiales bacterium]|nr:PilZ domain-containing protein [Burkholderiales bacterium]